MLTKEQRLVSDNRYMSMSAEAFSDNTHSIEYSIDYRQVRELFWKMDLTGNPLILDLCCGERPQSFIFAPSIRCRVVGIDFSLLGLTQATRNREQNGITNTFTSVVGSANKLPFPGKTFDIVAHSMALEHLEDPWGAMKEIVRVLKDGGRLFLYTPNRNFFIRRFWARVFPDHLINMGHSNERLYTYEEIESVFKECGLAVIEHCYPFNLVSAVWDMLLLAWFVHHPRLLSIILPAFRWASFLDKPLKMRKNSSALVIIGVKKCARMPSSFS